MKRERLNRLIALVSITISVIALSMLVSGCSKDCPTCPKEPHVPDYHLVYSYVEPDPTGYVITTYSTKSGQVIDSTFYPNPGDPFQDLQFSHDGEFACYTTNWNLHLGASETWVTRTATGDTVAYLKGTGTHFASVSKDDRFVLLTGGNLLAVLTFPNLGVVFRDSLSNDRGVLHPVKKIAYVNHGRNGDSILVLGFGQSPIAERWFALSNGEGNALISAGPLACTEQCLIVNPGLPDVTNYIQLYDPDSLSLIRETRTRFYDGLLHPDGKRLFLSYVTYFPGYWLKSGGIDVYNIETNTLYPYYSDGEVNLGVGQPFTPTNIQFTPDGETMYVLSAAGVLPFGPFLEIRTATKEIMRRFDNTSGSSRLIRLNPKDWAE